MQTDRPTATPESGTAPAGMGTPRPVAYVARAQLDATPRCAPKGSAHPSGGTLGRGLPSGGGGVQLRWAHACA